MFKKMSLSGMVSDLESTIRRFTLPALISACATAVSIILVNFIGDDDGMLWGKILVVLVLAFPLLISSVIVCERKGFDRKIRLIADFSILSLLGAYYFLLPKDLFVDGVGYWVLIRHVLWGIGAVLSVAFVGFLMKGKDSVIAFWHYNKTLVFSLALTAVYGVAIGGGLSIALTSINFLFDLNLDGVMYADIWSVVWSLFAPLFFLAHIPKINLGTKDEYGYPKELRLFTRFVLLPLVAIYFLILYSYTVKIVVSWEWPKSILAYMISGFSLLGVLTYVILHPLREQYSWVRRYGYMFFAVLIPQVGMLFWALWFRISQYSITENRALIFIFGSWLLAMAIYFLASRKKDIRLIPVTLFLITVLFSFGPWSIFSVSKNCQTNRLVGILKRYDAFSQGKIVKIVKPDGVSVEDRREISSIVGYLYDAHGWEYVQGFFNDSIKDGGDGKNYLTSEQVVERFIGIEFTTSRNSGGYEHFYINSTLNASFDVSDFDRLVIIENPGRALDDYGYSLTDRGAVFNVIKKNQVVASHNLDDLIKKNISETGDSYANNVAQDKMIARGESNNIFYELHLSSVSGMRSGQEENVSYENLHVSGVLLIKEK